MKKLYALILAAILVSHTSVADAVDHLHGDRDHSHALPQQGVPHKHGNAPVKLAKAHYHGARVHFHIFPGGEISHKHGNTPAGRLVNATPAVESKQTKPVKQKKYICSELSASEASSLYNQGHTYLDRDNDGKPCEPTYFSRYVRPSSASSTKSRCSYVGGYYRKSGTYVRGHMRCR